MGEFMKIMRWVLALPASLLCGYLAYILGGFLHNLSYSVFLGISPGWKVKVMMDVMSHMYMGATTTYVAVKITPDYPEAVAMNIFALILIFAGISIWSSFLTGKYYEVPSIAIFHRDNFYVKDKVR